MTRGIAVVKLLLLAGVFLALAACKGAEKADEGEFDPTKYRSGATSSEPAKPSQ